MKGKHIEFALGVVVGAALFGGQGSDAIRTEPVETTEQPASEE